MVSNLIPLWESAADIDPTLRMQRSNISFLERKYVKPISYARTRLFSRMVNGQVSLFHNCPVAITWCCIAASCQHLLQHNRKGFLVLSKTRIQAGPCRQRNCVTVPEPMIRSEGRR